MNFPFIYINHGQPIDIYSFQGEKHIVIWFEEHIPEKIKQKIEKLCPKPLQQMFCWGNAQVYCYSMSDEDEIFKFAMKKSRVNKTNNDENQYFLDLLQVLMDEIENWLKQVHDLATVKFAIGLDRVGGSEWDKWSKSQVQAIKEVVHNAETNLQITPSEKMIVEQTKVMLKG